MDKTNEERELPQRQLSLRQVSRDWAPFARNLSRVLARLEEDQFLILSAKRGNRYLQFSGQGAWGTRIEVGSNQFLKGEDRLTRQEVAWLRTHGWKAPTGTPKQATPDKDPDGSPNYFIDVPSHIGASDCVSMIVDTLIHGLSFHHPGALSYEAFDAAGKVLSFQELGLKSSNRADTPLMDAVLATFKEITGIEDLSFDEDGDVSIRYGVIVISAVQFNDRVRLYSTLVSQVTETPELLRKINQINDSGHRLRVFLNDRVVLAVLDVPAAPFVPAHLVAAMNEFAEVAEGLAIVLRAEFKGKVVIEPSGPFLNLH